MTFFTMVPLRAFVVVGLLELAEQGADLLVVVAEDDDGVGGHGCSWQ